MSDQRIHDVTYGSPWRNVYWFARMLLNTDQYGAIGKNISLMDDIVIKVGPIIDLDALSREDRHKICLDTLRETIGAYATNETRASVQRRDLLSAMEDELHTLDDVIVLIVTIKYVVLPTNAALDRIPSNDIEFCREQAKNILASLGKENVGKVLSVWDTLGVRGCLNVERAEVIAEFTKLRSNLESIALGRTQLEDNAILTAFVQEFERRAGQKQKNRAGGSLEDIATFLFKYYGFESHPKPDHFQTDIEVDKWFRCRDGWSIGISCKRTLRERWKQVSSADGHVLSRYKIREIWHLITYDKDLSDDKITMLGQQRQVFYLNDESERYKTASRHVGMKGYVRPLSHLIDDIAREQGKAI